MAEDTDREISLRCDICGKEFGDHKSKTFNCPSAYGFMDKQAFKRADTLKTTYHEREVEH